MEVVELIKGLDSLLSVGVLLYVLNLGYRQSSEDKKVYEARTDKVLAAAQEANNRLMAALIEICGDRDCGDNPESIPR